MKEKYEGDLKKEIKKLQRLRDQIKSWVGGNEIKDKSALIEARKVRPSSARHSHPMLYLWALSFPFDMQLIETKMEQFKICEKETKTKAYSREGLAREDKLDPREQDRENKLNWLQSCVDKLNELVETLDGEVDKITSGKSKAKSKGDEVQDDWSKPTRTKDMYFLILLLIINRLRS